MTTEEQVRSAGNIAEALAAVARGIDTLIAAVPPDAPPTDPFMQWDAAPKAAPTTQGVADLVKQLRALIEKETDPEEIQALNARLRLLTDTGEAVVTELPDSNVRPEIEVTEGGITVTVPPVDAARREARYDLAFAWDLSRFCNTLTREGGANAYAAGGPVWLHTFDRKAVIDMPIDWRKQMVHDVEQDNVAAAQELARDILKHGEGVSMELALEQQDQVRGG